MPSVDSLRCFVEAARLLSFRRAARRVALSPAALGQRIKQLEEELAAALFERSTRRVQLTDAGARLLPQAEAALQAIEQCRYAVRGEVGPVDREITVGTRHELGLSWLLPQLPQLEAGQPGLTVHLYFGSGTDLLFRVRSGEIDCAVTSSRLTDPQLNAVKLHEERYVFVGSPKLLEQRPVRRAADLKQHTLLDAAAELPLFSYWRDAPGGVDSLHFRRIISYGSIAAIRQRTLAQAGLAVLPEYYVRPDMRRGRLTEVLPRVRAHSDYFRLVFRANDARRALLLQIAEQLRSAPLR